MKMNYKLRTITLSSGKQFCLPSHYRDGNNEWVEVPFRFGCFLIGNEQVSLTSLYGWAYDEQRELTEKGCCIAALTYQLFADHIFEVIESTHLENVYQL